MIDFNSIESLYPAMFGWSYNEETKSKWIDFLNRHRDTFKDYNGYLRISRTRYKKIEELIEAVDVIDINGNEIRASHKAFVFSLYILLMEIRQGKKKEISIEDIKQLLGYSRKSDSIDFLLKEDGLLDTYGVTTTRTIGVSGDSHGKAKRIKYKTLTANWKDRSATFENGNYLRLEMPIFMYMLFNIREIGVKGIYMYCYMLSKCIMRNNEYIFTRLSEDKIIMETGFTENTVEKYLNILERHNLLMIKRGEYKVEEYGYIYNSGEFVGKEISEYRILTRIQMPI